MGTPGEMISPRVPPKAVRPWCAALSMLRRDPWNPWNPCNCSSPCSTTTCAKCQHAAPAIGPVTAPPNAIGAGCSTIASVKSVQSSSNW